MRLRRLRPRRLPALVLLVAASTALGACGAGPTSNSAVTPPAAVDVPAGGRIGVILPDVASSARWESADKPFLAAAFTKAGVDFDIRNAEGSSANFLAIADQMIADGVGVLMIVNLDSDSGVEVIRRAASAGIPVIDYDRLTLGGGAKYYVSFDNVAVGTAIGQGIVKALKAAGKRTANVVELDGSPTDNNAAQLKQGYDSVIRTAGYTIVASGAVPGWDDKLAVGVFRKLYTQAAGKVDAVAAANDGLGGAAVQVLAEHDLAGKVPVTGQDATDAALQRVLLGTQTMTVYKAIKLEADAAARLAIAMIKGDSAGADAQASRSVQHQQSGTYVKAVLLQPRTIELKTVKDVIADRYTTTNKLCATKELRSACGRAGLI